MYVKKDFDLALVSSRVRKAEHGIGTRETAT